MSADVLIIGAGPMALAHAAALRHMGCGFSGVCRSQESAEKFRAATGAPCHSGGLDLLLQKHTPAMAVVATPVADLAGATQRLIASGCRAILVEKPGGTTHADVARLAALAAAAGTAVHVAYNRRFYASVRRLRELAAEDGGVVSFHFEFTELADRVALLPYPPEVLANWELANSTHVIDTAFFIAGKPRSLQSMTAGVGDLPWHPRCARYVGHGVTESGALFSYIADWDAPGRWGIDVNTRRRRFVLRPMETLQVQQRGAFTLEPIILDDAADRACKPGLLAQMRAFVAGEDSGSLIGIAEHARSLAFVTTAILKENAAS